jgi:putative CocE/NonD family hydrolase
MPYPDDRFAGITSLGRARKLFESDPRVRVLLENGAGTTTPGLPAPTFELGFKRWPPREARPRTWYLGAGGTLLPAPPRGADEGVDAYAPDPEARPMETLLPGGDSWDLLPEVDWQPLAAGTAAAWATPPLEGDVTIVGPGSLDLWLRSSAEDTDLQVTLSEIRPDGLETYVQSGWLRASHRALDEEASSPLDPRPTHLAEDAALLPAGEFSLLRVGIFPVAHVFRSGSRIRVSVEAPGGDRTIWSFATPATGGSVVNEVARTAAQPSALVLPVVDGVEPPPALPPCPGLRGQPCRSYEPAANGG